MGLTDLAAVEAQIQKFWAPVFVKELRAKNLMAGLINKDYQGDLKEKGDTVKVSQVLAPKGNLKTVGTDADTFESEPLVTKQVEIKADKRATAAFELTDLVELQSQITSESSDIRDALRYSIDVQLNNHIKSLVAPSAAAPAHIITGVANFNAAQLSNLRMLAGQALWMKNKPWYTLVDPSYHKDLLDSQTLTSADFIGGRPVEEGEIPNKRFGWNILEDDSKLIDTALAFHPDFMHLVMQQSVRFKLSDLHSQKKFGFLLSVDMVFGAKLGIDGAKLHMTVGT